MAVKIDGDAIDIDWEHNHSVCTLESSNFKELSAETVDEINKLYEQGETPSTSPCNKRLQPKTATTFHSILPIYFSSFIVFTLLKFQLFSTTTQHQVLIFHFMQILLLQSVL